MSWTPIDLRAEAERAARIASVTGWQPVTWDGNFIAKLGFVRGELDEAVSAALEVMDTSRPVRDDGAVLHARYAGELADVAIRLFAVMHNIWGDNWRHDSVLQKPPMSLGPFCEPDVLFRPIRNSLRYAEERWRKDDQEAALSSLEDVFDDLFSAASKSCVDLGAAIVATQTVNENRPKLHGKARDLG